MRPRTEIFSLASTGLTIAVLIVLVILLLPWGKNQISQGEPENHYSKGSVYQLEQEARACRVYEQAGQVCYYLLQLNTSDLVQVLAGPSLLESEEKTEEWYYEVLVLQRSDYLNQEVWIPAATLLKQINS